MTTQGALFLASLTMMGAALYLASDASALVTGTSLVVDGDWTAD